MALFFGIYGENLFQEIIQSCYGYDKVNNRKKIPFYLFEEDEKDDKHNKYEIELKDIFGSKTIEIRPSFFKSEYFYDFNPLFSFEFDNTKYCIGNAGKYDIITLDDDIDRLKSNNILILNIKSDDIVKLEKLRNIIGHDYNIGVFDPQYNKFE